MSALLAEQSPPTFLIANARVRRALRLSPAFLRVVLESPAFEHLASHGFDTRFKMVFPGPTGQLPELHRDREDWFEKWRATPDEVRSPVRTYTVRDVVEEDGNRLLVVDLVVHEHGIQGPACRWALSARPGDEVQVIAPHRGNAEYYGTEFEPDGRRELLLVADETAVPALARIFADLEPGYSGRAFVEVPTRADILDIPAPDGIDVTWLVRQDAEYGTLLLDEVRRYLGLDAPEPEPAEVGWDPEIEVWETARYSAAGEDIESQLRRRAAASDLSGLYVWIAGESALVRSLRRSLVNEREVDRKQVAFMGYWRQGVSGRP